MSYKINGVQINTSTRGVTGYEGSTFSPAWTLDHSKPFIAAIGNPTDPELKKLLRAKERTALHLGQYSDSREAAYVVGLYKNDPVAILTELAETNQIDVEFPAELYSLPEFITVDEAIKKIQEAKPVKTDDRPADTNFGVILAKYDINKMKQMYGAEVLLQAKKVLTINEWELRFGKAA